jgi:formylglycine-generating enzyme required for sulfatase activity
MHETPRGCAVENEHVSFGGGVVEIGPDDWQTAESPARRVQVEAFSMDAFEVTHARWQACVQTGDCKPLDGDFEPGQPVTEVTPELASDFCRFEGGRLPTVSEFWMAARGVEGRKFPWGPTGLVCRRAAYGLVEGPCASGASGPELAGARPDGQTPDGIHDLAGNVAELTREASGAVVARGGSFRARVARELTGAEGTTAAPAPDIGFRCAYGPEPGAPRAE